MDLILLINRINNIYHYFPHDKKSMARARHLTGRNASAADTWPQATVCRSQTTFATRSIDVAGNTNADLRQDVEFIIKSYLIITM